MRCISLRPLRILDSIRSRTGCGWSRGFTLIEMMIALGISGIALTAMYQLFTNQAKVQLAQEEVVDAQKSVRLAVRLLVDDLRQAAKLTAGFVNDGITVNKDQAVNGAHEGVDFVRIVSFAPNPPVFLRARMLHPSASIKVQSVRGLTKGDFFVITDGVSADFFQSTQIMAGKYNRVQHNQSSPFNQPQGFSKKYGQGAQLYRVRFVDYAVDFSNPDVPRLVRDLHNGNGFLPLADYIEGLQVRLELGTTNHYKVTLVARTRRRDSSFSSGDNPLTVAQENDGFRRRVLTTTVVPRNFRDN